MEGQIGSVGHYEVTEKGIVEVKAGVGYPEETKAVASAELVIKVDIIEALKEAAKHTTNKVDDQLVAMVALALGRPVA